MIEFKDNYTYEGIKDVFIKDGENILKILYGGNGDLYFDIFGDRKKSDNQDYICITEFLIKNGNEEWFYFNRLISNIINEKDKNKDKLFERNILTWYSDEIYDERANKFSIEKLDEGIKLTFFNNPHDPNRGFGVRISNSGSKYAPLNKHFFNMYKEFQMLSKKEKAEIDIEDKLH